MAKRILQEIVRGIFLNSAATLQTIGQIARNAERAARAVQWNHYDGLAACLRESWRLNQALDPGTNPPAVQQILDPIRDYMVGGKLLGAGGGGAGESMGQPEGFRDTTPGPPSRRVANSKSMMQKRPSVMR